MSKPPIYQLKITLQGFRPPIWRRVLIAADATFFDLHSLIQDAFGWEDYHLHSFRGLRLNGKKRIYIEDPENSAEMQPPILEGFPAELMERQDEFFDEYTVTLSEHLNPANPRLIYEYDFGDSWQHEIFVEKVLDKSSQPIPLVVAGRRMGPPEDSRGWIDYADEIMAASQDKKSKAWRKWMADWDEHTMEHFEYCCTIFLSEQFDPSEVSITSPNERLKRYDEV